MKGEVAADWGGCDETEKRRKRTDLGCVGGRFRGKYDDKKCVLTPEEETRSKVSDIESV